MNSLCCSLIDVGVIHEILFPSPHTPISFASSLLSKNLTTTTTSFLTYCTPEGSIAYLLELGQTCPGIESILEVVVENLSGEMSMGEKVVEKLVVQGTGAGTGGEGTMEFLPLMLISLYCACGIIWAWGRLSWSYLRR